MRPLVTLAIAALAFSAPAAGQTPTPTPTQDTFTCTRTSAVTGEGFTLDCDVADAGTTDTDAADFTIRNVRRYKSSINVSHWLYFDIVAGINYDRFTLTVRLHYADGTFRDCTEYVPAMTANQADEGLVIPSVCGPDVEWSAVEFISPALTCSGCGVYQFADVPVGRAVPAGATDSALELDRVLEDYRLQAQYRR